MRFSKCMSSENLSINCVWYQNFSFSRQVGIFRNTHKFHMISIIITRKILIFTEKVLMFMGKVLIFMGKVLMFMGKVLIFMGKVLIFMGKVLIFTDVCTYFHEKNWKSTVFTEMYTLKSLDVYIHARGHDQALYITENQCNPNLHQSLRYWFTWSLFSWKLLFPPKCVLSVHFKKFIATRIINEFLIGLHDIYVGSRRW